jgi:radical SAM superfamily enzyme YgiQ (UPF0313 family)
MSTDAAPPRPIRRVVCIQLGGEYPDFCHRLVMPDYGMPLIGTILAQAGYEVTVFVEHVSPPVWDVIASADLVCMSTLSAAADKTYRLADRIRDELRVPVVMGGTHATYFAEDCLRHCDAVVLGEGDETILELIPALAAGGAALQTVPGVAYREQGAVRRSAARPGPLQFPTAPDFKLIHGYRRLSRWDSLREVRLPLMTVQATRGCPYRCSYCIVETMFGDRYRTREIESVIGDLRDKRQYGRELLFVDNNFAANPRYTAELLNRIIEEDFGFDIMVLTRADVAGRDELLPLMRRAGITQLYQGYESVEAATLAAYHKRQDLGAVRAAIAKLQAAGFRISGSFVLGADTDDLDTVRATVDFVLESGLTIAYFFPLWGNFAERREGNRSIVPRHRAIFKDWAHCDGNFVSHFPKRMRPSQLQRAIIESHREVFSVRTAVGALGRGSLVQAWEKATHRWMWNTIQRGLDAYLPWLEEIEDGLYSRDGQLMEERLLARWAKGPAWRFPDADGLEGQAGAAPPEPFAPVNDPTCRPALTRESA